MPNKSCLGRKTTWEEEEKEAGLRLFSNTFRTFEKPLKKLGELGLTAPHSFSRHSGCILTLESLKSLGVMAPAYNPS